MSPIRFAAAVAGSLTLLAATRHTAPAADLASLTVATAPATTTHRAEMVMLHIDNRTSLYIEVSVGGAYIGTVQPYGDLYEAVSTGEHRISAIARFDDGSSRTWGPVWRDLEGNYTLDLN